MNYTANYQLPQWVETDRILMDDFNDSYSKLDAALKTNADGLAAETAARTAALAAKGNCQIYTAIYIGTGDGQPVSHIFPQKPLFIMVGQSGGLYGFIAGDSMVQGMVGASLTLTWNGSTVTWYSAGTALEALNSLNGRYFVLALLEKTA